MRRVLRSRLALTVALALVTVLAFAACVCGCMTNVSTLVYDDIDNPLIRMSNNGILFDGKFVTPQESVDLLIKHSIPTNSVVYVLIDDDFTSQQAMWTYKHKFLTKNGYSRAQLVHKRRSESGTSDQLQPKLNQRVVPYESNLPKTRQRQRKVFGVRQGSQ